MGEGGGTERDEAAGGPGGGWNGEVQKGMRRVKRNDYW